MCYSRNPSIVAFAGSSYRRFHIGRDGKTPLERILGRPTPAPVAHFGEAIWWKPLSPSTRPGALDDRFQEGFFIGYVDGSSQYYVLTPTGVVRCRTISRRPDPEKWNQTILSCMASVLQPNALKPGEARVGDQSSCACGPRPCTR